MTGNSRASWWPGMFPILFLLARSGVPAPLPAQIPDTLVNLQYFSEDVGRDSVVESMRQFSFALGVRCQYCHVGGDGVSLEGVDFASDEDPDKRKARFMLRMTETLNRSMLPLIPERDTPPRELTCKSCHRGSPRPTLLIDVVRQALDEHGPDSAAVRYRRLREEEGLRGRFDFGEWEMNTLADRLEREDRLRDAIAVLRINEEAHPRSRYIALTLARLHEEVGEPEEAVRWYERVLVLDPDHARARERLEALRDR